MNSTDILHSVSNALKGAQISCKQDNPRMGNWEYAVQSKNTNERIKEIPLE
jgi:hypothetical protein